MKLREAELRIVERHQQAKVAKDSLISSLNAASNRQDAAGQQILAGMLRVISWYHNFYKLAGAVNLGRVIEELHQSWNEGKE